MRSAPAPSHDSRARCSGVAALIALFRMRTILLLCITNNVMDMCMHTETHELGIPICARAPTVRAACRRSVRSSPANTEKRTCSAPKNKTSPVSIKYSFKKSNLVHPFLFFLYLHMLTLTAISPSRAAPPRGSCVWPALDQPSCCACARVAPEIFPSALFCRESTLIHSARAAPTACVAYPCR